MLRIKTFFEVVLLGLIGVLLIILPSVNIKSFMHSTQSGKTFIFLCVVLLLAFIYMVSPYKIKGYKEIRFCYVDALLLFYLFFITVNIVVRNIPISTRALELWGLAFLYVTFRRLNSGHFMLLLLLTAIGGAIQAIYGNLQLWGISLSNHGLFKLTGSFFNPGPYAGYLASVFPVVVGLYIFKLRRLTRLSKSFLEWLTPSLSKITRWKSIVFSNFIDINEKKFLKDGLEEKSNSMNVSYSSSLAFTLGILIILVLPASRSRAAWLAVLVSSCYLLYVRYDLKGIFCKLFNTKRKRYFISILSIILFFIASIGIFYLKEGSSNGRILIWRVSMKMISDSPWLGKGFDQFKANYMNYQADFFKENPNIAESMVAGDSNFAFNEIIQQTVENGILSLLFIGLVIYVIFVRKDNSKRKKPSVIGDREILIYISKAGIISILVFSLFSYPAQILPIKLSLVLYLAINGALSLKTIQIPQRLNSDGFGQFRRVIYRLALMILLFWGCKSIYNYQKAFVDWRKAYERYQFGAYHECLESYKSAYSIFETNGDFLTNYGKALSMAENHDEAVKILKIASVFFPNTVVYTALGDSYKKLHHFEEAEEAYLHAWHMNPSKFYPKYLLAKLYHESGQKEKANLTANELLKKEVKIQSTAISEIKEEMKKMLK